MIYAPSWSLPQAGFIGGAADRLYRTPSAITRQLKRLEAALGCPRLPWSLGSEERSDLERVVISPAVPLAFERHFRCCDESTACRFTALSLPTLRQIFLGQRRSDRLGLHHDARNSPSACFFDRLNAVDAARDLLAIALQRVAAP
jgi:hypothetical protein